MRTGNDSILIKKERTALEGEEKLRELGRPGPLELKGISNIQNDEGAKRQSRILDASTNVPYYI